MSFDISGARSALKDAGIIFKENVPAGDCTTFKTGGEISIVACPQTSQQYTACISTFKKNNVPFYILGNGSNLLVLDGGFHGVLVSTVQMDSVSVDGHLITALAGTRLKALVNASVRHGLTGLEFAGGIPGTVGGGVYMNAGAYDGELSDFIDSALVSDGDGNVKTLSNADLHLSYRHSRLMDEPLFLISCTFRLTSGDREASMEKVRRLNARRREKQPLEYPSAGSTFKRPEGHFAGALIEAAGMKGVSVGGAQVSEKHAGFIINKDNASASDIAALIEKVQQAVFRTSGVVLEPEVRMIGTEAKK